MGLADGVAWETDHGTSPLFKLNKVKSFSNEQLLIVKHLMDLESEIDNRIKIKNQEVFLRKSLDDKTILTELDCLEDSIKYMLEEKFRLIKNLLV